MRVDLDWDERQRLVELLGEYRDEVHNGRICGFPQSKEDELAEVDALVRKLGPEEGG